MKSFELASPGDVREALALFARHAPDARALAGGTDLLVELRGAREVPRLLVDLSRVTELKTIALSEEGLTVGALATHAEIAGSALVAEVAPVLAEAARSIGAVQTRNLGTIGGNLASAVPCLDSGPALAVLDALVTLASVRGVRRVALGDFFTGPRATVLRPDELITEILVPRRVLGKPAAFLKFGLRRGQALALVNAAASLRLEGGRVREPRLALGAVAPTVLRAAGAESYLEGRALSPGALAEAARLAAAETRPISDHRASADYRRELAAVLARRALERAGARAGWQVPRCA